MTDPVTIALIATGGAVIGLVPATMLAWATLRTSKANSVKADIAAGQATVAADKATVASDKVDVLGEKADAIIKKSEEIHSQTDGHLTAMTKQLEEANARVAAMEKLVAQVNELVQGNRLMQGDQLVAQPPKGKRKKH